MTALHVETWGESDRTAVLVHGLSVDRRPTANRDPELIGDPDRLDITRKATSHVGFGHGIHHCLGAPLARMEMRIAFPALLRRFPELRPAVPHDQAAFAPHKAIYGLSELPVTW